MSELRLHRPWHLLICLIGFFSAGSAVTAQSVSDFQQQISRLIDDGFYGEALALGRRSLDLFEDEPSLIVAVAALAVRVGDTAYAADLVKDALEKGVGDPQLLSIVAELKLRMRQPELATQLLRQLVQLHPGNADNRFRLAESHFLSGRPLEAIEEARRAVELQPENAHFRRRLALYLEIAGNYDEAFDHLKASQKLSPSDPRILLRLADREKSKNRLGRALEYLELARDADPENPLFWWELSKLYRLLEMPESSEAASLMAQQLENAFENLRQSIRLVRSGKESEGIVLLERTVEELPQFLTGAEFLADLYQKTGKTQEAGQIYDQILKADPARIRARRESAWIRLRSGELVGALNILAASPELKVDSILLEAYRRQLNSDWMGAFELFKEVEKEYPLDESLLRQLSASLNSAGRPREALNYLQKAYSVRPGDPQIEDAARRIRFEHALKLEKAGKCSEARSILEGLLNEEGRSAYFFHLGYCLQQLNQHSSAVSQFQRGLRLEPEADWVRINLALSLYYLGRYPEATEQWETLVGRKRKPEYVYNLGLSLIRQWQVETGWNLVEEAARNGYEPARRLMQKRKSR